MPVVNTNSIVFLTMLHLIGALEHKSGSFALSTTVSTILTKVHEIFIGTRNMHLFTIIYLNK